MASNSGGKHAKNVHSETTGANDTKVDSKAVGKHGVFSGRNESVEQFSKPERNHSESSSQDFRHEAQAGGLTRDTQQEAPSGFKRNEQSSISSSSDEGKKKRATIVFRVALVVLIAALIGLGAVIYQYWSQDKYYSDMKQYVKVSDSENISLASLTVDWDALRAINPDIVAWIYVPDTKINYPVVQGDDNEEYLHKAFNSTEGWLASAGTIFLDSNNNSDLSDRNNAMYGHHMNDGSMFAGICEWEDTTKFNENRTIYILTPQGNYRCTTFAVVKTVGTDAIVQTSFASRASYTNYIQDKLNRSVVTQEGTVLTASDINQSFLLSTCEYSQNDGRLLVFAAAVETTVQSNPYVSEGTTVTTTGTTGLTKEQASQIGN